MAEVDMNPRDWLTIIMFLVGLFGGKKKKKVALRLFPLAASAIDQWDRGGVKDALERAAASEPSLELFRRTIDEGIEILNEAM
jgi:hypothetical protein